MSRVSLIAAWLLIWAAGLGVGGLILKVMWLVFMAGWGLV